MNGGNCYSCFFNTRQSKDGCICEVRSLTHITKEEMDASCVYYLSKNYTGELYTSPNGYKRPKET